MLGVSFYGREPHLNAGLRWDSAFRAAVTNKTTSMASTYFNWAWYAVFQAQT
jgi:hypothetical protein